MHLGLRIFSWWYLAWINWRFLLFNLIKLFLPFFYCSSRKIKLLKARRERRRKEIFRACQKINSMHYTRSQLCYAPKTLTQIRFNVPFLYIVGERGHRIAVCVCDLNIFFYFFMLLTVLTFSYTLNSIFTLFFRGRVSTLDMKKLFLLLNLNLTWM